MSVFFHDENIETKNETFVVALKYEKQDNNILHNPSFIQSEAAYQKKIEAIAMPL